MTSRAVLRMWGVACFAATALAQTPIRPAVQPNSSAEQQALQQRAQLHRQQKARFHGADKDDPLARRLALRLQRGVPTTALRDQLFSIRQARSTSSAKRSIPTGGNGSVPTWIPIGPTDAAWEQNGPAAALTRDSGRMRTILPHPTNPDIVYVLTSGGGLWVTHNFTSAPPTWTPLTDSLVTTGGGSVAFGRTPSTLYLGLGDPFDLINLGGVMVMSTDGGANWSAPIRLGSGYSIRDLEVDTAGTQDVVMVATDYGFFRSADGGATYNEVTGPGNAFQGASVWSLVRTSAGWLMDVQPCTTSDGTFCQTASTLYLSTDHGLTWSAITNAGNGFNGAGRTTLAVGAPGDSVVYAFAENSSSTDQGDLFRSTDGGQTWSPLLLNTQTPTNPNSDNPDMDLMHDQAWYNQMILVDPRDPARNTVYLGGNLSTAKTTNGGNSWTLLTNWLYGEAFSSTGSIIPMPYAHADFHAAAISLAGVATLMFGNDGGLFVSTDDGASWSSDKNVGLQTHLFYSLISTPAVPWSVMGGLQDNGTRVREGATTVYNQPVGGDGIGAGWSQANAAAAITSVEFNDNFANLTAQLPDLNEDFFETLPPLNNDADFLTPMETPSAAADPTGTVFFTASVQRLDRTSNGGWTWTTMGQVGSAGIPSTVSFRQGAHVVGVSPLDLQHVAVVGTQSHLEITTNGGVSWSDHSLAAVIPAGFLGSVTWADNQTLYVVSVGDAPGTARVAKSQDGGSSWIRADSGLPDVPINRIVVDPSDATHSTLLAATDAGVYRSADAAVSWSAYGAGLPNVAVTDIYLPPDGSFARVATFGRGVWELPSISFSAAALTADANACSTNGALDNGGTAQLAITLHNSSGVAVNNLTATVTSSNPAVSFPAGTTLSFPPAAGSADTTASLPVALTGAAGVQQLDFTVAFTNPAENLGAPVTATASFRANYDNVAGGSANDDVSADTSAWTAEGTAESLPDIVPWQRRRISPLEYRWAGLDSNLASDESLVSPVLQVGTASFTISFEQRYLFEFDSRSGAYYDGMVVEISADNGNTWQDIGGQAVPGYDHVLTATGGGNVLEGRSAYTGYNTAYPGFTSVTINLGTTYAGKSVRVRFRVGTDQDSGYPGVEVRNITTTGLLNTPFTAITAHQSACGVTVSLASSLNPSRFGDSITLTASVSGGFNTATGTVTFNDGGTSLGMGTLDGSGTAQLTTSALAAGSHSITAAYSGDTSHASATSSALTQVVNPLPPAVTEAFAAAEVALHGTVQVTITVTNPNAGSTLTGVGFSEVFPAGLATAVPSGLAKTCDGTAIAAGFSSLTLTGATLAGGASCTVSFSLQGTIVGVQTVLAAATSVEGGTGTAGVATVTVVGPPSINEMFGAASVPLNGSTSLTFTIANANAVALTGVSFADTLPSGLAVANPSGLSFSCGTVTIVPGYSGDQIQLAGGTVPASSSCTITLNVTGTAAGNLVNTTGAVSSDNGGIGNAATASITVGAADLTITVTHNGSFLQGQTGAQYSLAVSNTGTEATQGSVTVVDSLPMGLTITAIAGSGWTCTVSAATCARSDSLAAGSSYPPIVVTVDVATSLAGNVTNSAMVSGGGDGNTANDAASDVTFIAPAADLTVAASDSGGFIEGGAGSFSITVKNAGLGATVGSVSVTATLPAGIAVTSVSGSGWNCATTTLTCTRSDVLAAGANYAAISLAVNVALDAPASEMASVIVSGGGEWKVANDGSADTVAIGPALTVMSAASTVTVSRGNTAVFSLSLAGSSASGAVSFSAMGVPTGATATFSPSSVSQLPAQVQMSIATAIPGTAHKLPGPLGRWPFVLAISLAGVLGVVNLGGGGRRSRLRFLVLGVLAVALLTLLGCGGGSPRSSLSTTTPTTTVAAGTYNITVTATGSNGAVQAKTSVTLVVQ